MINADYKTCSHTFRSHTKIGSPGGMKFTKDGVCINYWDNERQDSSLYTTQLRGNYSISKDTLTVLYNAKRSNLHIKNEIVSNLQWTELTEQHHKKYLMYSDNRDTLILLVDSRMGIDYHWDSFCYELSK